MSHLKKVSVLGATGSIGESTVNLLGQQTDDTLEFKTVALTASTNVARLAEQAKHLNAEIAVIRDENLYSDLKSLLSGTSIEVAAGDGAIVEAAALDAEIVVSAITGAAALSPTLAAVRQGANIALANKESIVCAGRLLLDEARSHNSNILPVDSEHNAIFQVLDNKRRVEKLVLTASGGPFRSASIEMMRNATPEQAVAHPNWSMGAKISIDSATMTNKALELIEACYLFDMSQDRVDVLVHPQSIIHSMVSYDDGSVLAQLGMPDMRTPISYALAWPNRMPVPNVERLDLAKIGRLNFEAVDDARFPAISLARKAIEIGAWATNVFNATNEVAVDAFVNGRIGFLDISALNKTILEGFLNGQFGNVEDPKCFEGVFDLDQRARVAAHNTLSATV